VLDIPFPVTPTLHREWEEAWPTGLALVAVEVLEEDSIIRMR
jgi:hypothetical protein